MELFSYAHCCVPLSRRVSSAAPFSFDSVPERRGEFPLLFGVLFAINDV